jgi:hypothetical protein
MAAQVKKKSDAWRFFSYIRGARGMGKPEEASEDVTTPVAEESEAVMEWFSARAKSTRPPPPSLFVVGALGTGGSAIIVEVEDSYTSKMYALKVS